MKTATRKATHENVNYDRDVIVVSKTAVDEVSYECLLNLKDQYGTVTPYGEIWKKCQADLERHLRFVFSATKVVCVRMTMVP
jgi:hypothetical protein